MFVEGSLEAKLPTIRTDGQAQPGRSLAMEKGRREKKRDGKDQRWRKSEERRCRCAKGRKGVKHLVFPIICGPGGSKSRLAKAAGAEPAGQMKDEKVHAVVARSAFGSKKCQSTSGSDERWKLRC